MARFVLVLSLLSIAWPVARASADASSSGPGGDYLFPEQGALAFGAATGVPYVGIGEVTFGLHRNVALGVLGGATPTVSAVGFRPRIAVDLTDDWRLQLVAPSFYYPRTNMFGHMSWVLTHPTLTVEHRFRRGFRVHAGIGMVAASCSHRAFHPRQHRGQDDEGFMSGIWNTFDAGAAFPITRRFDLFVLVSTVNSGFRLGEDWLGGPRVVVVLGGTVRL